jgi:hypothetical protein
VVVPLGRQQTIVSRLRVMPQIREAFEWLQWDGESLSPLSLNTSDPETYVQQFHRPDVDAEVWRLLQLAPDLLQAVPDIAARGISVRLRGLELARVCESETVYPLGEPLEQVILEVDAARRYRSLHPLARAHEERWLESNLIGRIGQVLPSVDPAHIYPQVPSFVGEERGIIDLLTVTRAGRLVVIEIKASADPDLPFQALDYWIAVERHRKAGDFNRKGYFAGRVIEDTPALLVLAAPLLAYHKTLGRTISVLPQDLPLVEIGLNQTWKREIKVLRRRGYVG